MNNLSFTDDQLLNLVNNTITNKTEYEIADFTGGSVQVTSTNNHQLIKYKVSLFFGYNNRNAINYTFPIKEDFISIWQEAIMLKVKSLQTSNNGMDYSELNALMNNIESEQVEVVSNKVVSKGSTTNRTNNRTKSFSFSLSKLMRLENTSNEYKAKLEEYINKSGKELSYIDFYNSCEMKGYKYKNFKLVYDKWTKDDKSNNSLGGWSE